MKGFIKYILRTLLILVALMYLLEFAYNSIYKRGAYRNKVMWMHDIKDKSLDYAVFGSSRANNFVVPNIIFNTTGQKGLNLAIQASGPLEIELAVREYLARNTAKRFFIQVDYMYNQESPHRIGQLSWLPYIAEDAVYDIFKPYDDKYWFYKNVPFYRYQMNDSRIGYRNVILSKLKKGTDFQLTSGFTPTMGNLKKDKPFNFSLDDKPNPHFITINAICEEKNIEVIYFTSPIYRPVGNFDVLKKHLPNYYDFSTAVSNMELFSNPDHLNKKGAIVFTNLLVDWFFSGKANNIKE